MGKEKTTIKYSEIQTNVGPRFFLDDSENPEIPFEIVDVREKSYNEADHAYFMEKDTGKAISAIQAFWFV